LNVGSLEPVSESAETSTSELLV